MANYPSIDAELLRSFVAIADHGGFTRAAEAVNRTQSAISMQMKRLEEDVLQRSVFERDGRQVKLTAEGQILLGYARRILKLHGEVLTTLREPHMVGSVRIGTPDDYVMRFLPGILSRFAQAYPLVQVEVHCEPSYQLLQRRDLDLSIVTREPGTEIGQLLRQERIVWAEAQGFCPHEQEPLPLAGVGDPALEQHLDRHVPVEVELAGAPHHPHASPPQLALQAIAAELAAGLQLGRRRRPRAAVRARGGGVRRPAGRRRGLS